MTDSAAAVRVPPPEFDDVDEIPDEVFDAPPPPASDDAQADRWLWAVGSLEREESRLAGLAKSRTEQVREWLEREVGILVRKRRWFEQGLEQHARSRFAKDPKPNRKYPAGTLKLLPRPSKVTFSLDGKTEAEAEQAFCRWALLNGYPDLVRVTYAPDRQAIAKLTPAPEERQVRSLDGRSAEVDVADVFLVAPSPDEGAPPAEILPFVELVTPAERSFSIKTTEEAS